ncbi:hypothetical protein A5791_12470 [Mycobacterium sp. 852002-51163_SCH5372311]|uniref:hypothetical protein n=1 Tax=Mycobacterium sp. 852002-51163_SCH5372311 TaxID=1834097 RepID=UPI0007FD3256|nr:hypothetical protein [Mycobacterium sp. 852002-51163_SCH5372311]OBF93822.1 hypothetical protein A5791_12470 [Mycobacterium sp. 852002-51163_SCH5372311]
MSAETGETVSKIFLSCDLTGSTNFKQLPRKPGGTPWQKVFLQFYREFPQQIATITATDPRVSDLKFELWKPIGDELIYSCAVGSEADVYNAVRAWTTAIGKYREDNLKDTPMGTKGGAFIATFPGPDSYSSIPRLPEYEDSDGDVVLRNAAAQTARDDLKYLYDYFGPSFDTGFRVLSKCSERYFTLSVEVAFAMFSLHVNKGRQQYPVDDLQLLDFVELKGVWSGKPYPVVAIDVEHQDPVHQAYAKFERRGSADELHELCKACYTKEDWPSKMWLPSAHLGMFKDDKPPDPFENYVAAGAEGAEKVPDEPSAPQGLRDNPPLA